MVTIAVEYSLTHLGTFLSWQIAMNIAYEHYTASFRRRYTATYHIPQGSVKSIGLKPSGKTNWGFFDAHTLTPMKYADWYLFAIWSWFNPAMYSRMKFCFVTLTNCNWRKRRQSCSAGTWIKILTHGYGIWVKWTFQTDQAQPKGQQSPWNIRKFHFPVQAGYWHSAARVWSYSSLQVPGMGYTVLKSPLAGGICARTHSPYWSCPLQWSHRLCWDVSVCSGGKRCGFSVSQIRPWWW